MLFVSFIKLYLNLPKLNYCIYHVVWCNYHNYLLLCLLTFTIYSEEVKPWMLQQLLCEFKLRCKPHRSVSYLHPSDFYCHTHQPQTALWAENKNDCFWIHIICFCAQPHLPLSLHLSAPAFKSIEPYYFFGCILIHICIQMGDRLKKIKMSISEISGLCLQIKFSITWR